MEILAVVLFVYFFFTSIWWLFVFIDYAGYIERGVKITKLRFITYCIIGGPAFWFSLLYDAYDQDEDE